VKDDNDLAAQIAEVIRSVLGAVESGVDEDFFAQGGDSILALNVVSRINGKLRTLNRSLTPTDLYDHPTPRRLAAYLGSADQGQPALTSTRETKPATTFPDSGLDEAGLSDLLERFSAAQGRT
jgi:hypothetical protein